MALIPCKEICPGAGKNPTKIYAKAGSKWGVTTVRSYATTLKFDKGICPDCGHIVSVKLDGSLRKHKRDTGTFWNTRTGKHVKF